MARVNEGKSILKTSFYRLREICRLAHARYRGRKRAKGARADIIKKKQEILNFDIGLTSTLKYKAIKSSSGEKSFCIANLGDVNG